MSYRDGVTMYVGGQATHWTAQTPRFTPEDFRLRSFFGVGEDWPIDYAQLEPHYCEAERRLGVSGEPGGLGVKEGFRSEPFPMPSIPLSYDLGVIRDLARDAGLDVCAAPYAKNSQPYDGRPACMRCDTCYVCPTGAKYSPDLTLGALVAAGKVGLHPRTFVRRLEIGEGERVVRAHGIELEGGEAIAFESQYYVLATGFPLTPQLLAHSATSRFPKGLANSSGTLGRYIQGHPVAIANFSIDRKLYGWMHEQHRVMTRQYMCVPASTAPLARFDVSLMAVPRLPLLRSRSGEVLFGDALLEDWKSRSGRGLVQLRSLIDVYFDRDSAIVDNPALVFPWGDPLPSAAYVYTEEGRRQAAAAERAIRSIVERFTTKAGGEVEFFLPPVAHPHPGGGCRMGKDPATSVCDDTGRCHDHDNVYVAGAPLLVTGGCTNATLTFCALALRSASFMAERLRKGSPSVRPEPLPERSARATPGRTATAGSG
jgi:quinoprotein glucose dehydrogenase